MNIRSILKLLVVLATGVLMVACMTPSQQLAALQALDEMHKSGAITDAQFDDLRQGIVAAGTATFWQQVVGTVGSAVLTYAGVQARRGPVATPEERVARRARRG